MNPIISIVFPRPWLKAESDILDGVDFGRFASALIGSDQVIVEISSFRELGAIIEKIGSSEIEKLLKKGRLKFVVYPENPTVIHDRGRSLLGTMVFPVDARSAFINSVQLSLAIRNTINDYSRIDLEISAPFADKLAEHVSVVPSKFHDEVIRAIAVCVSDPIRRESINGWAQNHFGTSVSLVDCIKTEGNRPPWIDVSICPTHERVLAEKRATTLLLALAEAYKEYSLACLNGASSIYTDEATLGLIGCLVAISKGQVKVSAPRPVDVVTKSIKLPSIQWMVNRGVLPLGAVVDFSFSDNGAAFLGFLRQFISELHPDESLAEKMRDAIIRSFHDKTWWEEAWTSTGGQLTRLTVTQLPSLIPGIAGIVGGLIAGVGDFSVSKIIPKNFRPSLIVENALCAKIDAARLLVQKRIKKVYPSLVKLQKRGFAATMALKMHGEWICLLLDRPGIEEHWEIKIDLADPDAKIYLSAFEAILPPHGTEARKLVDALGEGASIERIQDQYRVGPPASLRKVYCLKLSNGQIAEIGDDAPEFMSFVKGRSYLANPQRYEAFRRKCLGMAP